VSQRLLSGGDVFPRSSVTVKLSTYRAPSGAPMGEEEQQAYRALIVDVVFIAWRRLHRPICLWEICFGVDVFKNGLGQERLQGVQERVQSRIDNDLWPFARFARSKRTVDRRVNDAASPEYYEDHKARIVCVTPGVYQPNPALFKEPLEVSA